MPAEHPKRPFEVYDELLERILTEVPERAEQKSEIKRLLYESYQNGKKAADRPPQARRFPRASAN